MNQLWHHSNSCIYIRLSGAAGGMGVGDGGGGGYRRRRGKGCRGVLELISLFPYTVNKLYTNFQNQDVDYMEK